MVDVQSTPDSAVSPTYSSYQTVVDGPAVSLDPFCYQDCPAAFSLVHGGVAAADMVDVSYHAAAAVGGLHHGPTSKRLKYTAVDDVNTVTDVCHHQQSTSAVKLGLTSLGIYPLYIRTLSD